MSNEDGTACSARGGSWGGEDHTLCGGIWHQQVPTPQGRLASPPLPKLTTLGKLNKLFFCEQPTPRCDHHAPRAAPRQCLCALEA